MIIWNFKNVNYVTCDLDFVLPPLGSDWLQIAPDSISNLEIFMGMPEASLAGHALYFCLFTTPHPQQLSICSAISSMFAIVYVK